MVYKSPLPDLDIPKTNILDHLFPSAREPSKEPLWIDATDPSHFLSPETALQWIKRLGFGMKRIGIQRGDVCMIFTPNHIYVPVAYLTFVGYGAAFSGSNPSYTVQEMVYQIENTEAKLILVHPDLIQTALAAVSKAGVPKSRLFLFSDQQHDSIDGVEDWRTMIGTEEEGRKWEWRKLSPEESMTQTATVNFSSGTTGLPKGVCISHRNLISNAEQIKEVMKLKSSSRECWIGFLPLYHAYGQCFMIIMATTLHIPVIIMKAFVFEEYLRIIQEHSVTKLQVVPPIMILLDKRPEALKYDLSSVKEILCGAAPMSRDLQEVISRKFSVRVTQAWGMTETTCCGVSNSPDGMNPQGSIGQIVPNTEIKLVDDDGVEVTTPNTRGEVFIRGPQVGLRYWRNPEASKDSFDAEGWFKTGDIAVIDEEEYIWLVDRKKELIKVNGLQVSPAELEAALLENKDIADAAVVGITVHDRESPRAYIRMKEDTAGKISEADIQEWIKPRVAKHKWLTGGVVFIPEIPKLASGKIQRKVMREWAKRDALEMESRLGIKARL